MKIIDAILHVTRSVCLMIACALLLAVTGCSDNAEPTRKDTVKSERSELRPVSVRLQWFHSAQFAAFYVAKEKGYYEQAGLDVTLHPGGPDFNAISLVLSRSDDFGVWTADQLLSAASKGMPVQVLAAIYREDPNVLMVREDSDIVSPDDFVGKSITTVFGRSTEVVLRALLAHVGLEWNQVNVQPFPYNLQSFLNGSIDISAAFVYDHPYVARQHGANVRTIRPADYGIAFYSDVLFTRRALVESDPALIKAFVGATLRGLEYALDENHHEQTLDHVMQYAQHTTREAQSYMLRESEPLIRAERPEMPGYISEESLTSMNETLMKFGFIDKMVDLPSFYTNTFVKAWYENER